MLQSPRVWRHRQTMDPKYSFLVPSPPGMRPCHLPREITVPNRCCSVGWHSSRIIQRVSIEPPRNPTTAEFASRPSSTAELRTAGPVLL